MTQHNTTKGLYLSFGDITPCSGRCKRSAEWVPLTDHHMLAQMSKMFRLSWGFSFPPHYSTMRALLHHLWAPSSNLIVDGNRLEPVPSIDVMLVRTPVLLSLRHDQAMFTCSLPNFNSPFSARTAETCIPCTIFIGCTPGLCSCPLAMNFLTNHNRANCLHSL